jgi:hypothetical protein
LDLALDKVKIIKINNFLVYFENVSEEKEEFRAFLIKYSQILSWLKK